MPKAKRRRLKPSSVAVAYAARAKRELERLRVIDEKISATIPEIAKAPEPTLPTVDLEALKRAPDLTSKQKRICACYAKHQRQNPNLSHDELCEIVGREISPSNPFSRSTIERARRARKDGLLR